MDAAGCSEAATEFVGVGVGVGVGVCVGGGPDRQPLNEGVAWAAALGGETAAPAASLLLDPVTPPHEWDWARSYGAYTRAASTGRRRGHTDARRLA